MLESATWRTKNRKHYAVLEELYRQAYCLLRTEGWDPQNHDEYAAGLAHKVGSYLLSYSIGAGEAKDGKLSTRRSGKAWRQVSPEAGARASVFLTLGVAAILSPEVEGKEYDEAVISDARDLVLRTFAVSDDDLQQIDQVKAGVVETLNDEFIKEAVERGGLADRFAIQRGQVALSYYAMKMAGVDVDEMPAFEPVRGVPPEMWDRERGFDWLVTFSIDFASMWLQAKESYLEMAFARNGTADTDSLGYQLVAHALDRQEDPPWEWDEGPVAVAVVKTADKLSQFRGEFNLVLDAFALGYWLRRAELELTDGFNSFDPDYVAQLKEKFEQDPDTILTIAMTEVSQSLPKPFAQGPEVWSEVVELAITVLEERGRRILADPEFDDEVELPSELREFVLGLGYGLAVTVDAVGVEGTRPRQVYREEGD